jgi:hypothetical protein
MTDQHGNEWYVNDTRGYSDPGPSCDECGACECECPWCASSDADKVHGVEGEGYCCAKQAENNPFSECIGLSVAYVCLDGGESLCEACFEKADITLSEEE